MAVCGLRTPLAIQGPNGQQGRIVPITGVTVLRRRDRAIAFIREAHVSRGPIGGRACPERRRPGNSGRTTKRSVIAGHFQRRKDSERTDSTQHICK